MLTHDTAIAAARKVSEIALATATENDEKALFPEAAVAELGASGLLGLTLPKDVGGSGLGPRTFSAVAAVLAEADPSLGMIYTMHVSAAACFVAGREKSPNANTHLRAMAEGKHLTTLAFSEKGSRSHFWAPVSKVKRTANGVCVRTADRTGRGMRVLRRFEVAWPTSTKCSASGLPRKRDKAFAGSDRPSLPVTHRR